MSPLVGYLLLFLVVGFGFIFVHLVAGSIVRPSKPARLQKDKLTIYECGEPTIGSAWVQFDVRYYVIALLFVIFDVEVAFFFPWAVVFGQANAVATVSPEAELSSAQARLAKRELLNVPEDQPLTDEERQAGRQLGWLALGDIAVFFGVLLVGFAYLWKRGDLAWVRSTSAEAPPPPVTAASPLKEDGVLVGAGH